MDPVAPHLDDPRLLGRHSAGEPKVPEKLRPEDVRYWAASALSGVGAAAAEFAAKAPVLRPGRAKVVQEVKVRAAKSKEAEIVGLLREGMFVTVHEVCTKSAHVEYAVTGLTGWVTLSKNSEPVLKEDAWAPRPSVKKAQDKNWQQVASWVKSAKGQPDLVLGLRGEAYFLLPGKDGGAIRNFALKAECTHLGCLASWNRVGNKFVCPCHGSQYDENGSVLKGPAPNSLALAHVELTETQQAFYLVLRTGGHFPSTFLYASCPAICVPQQVRRGAGVEVQPAAGQLSPGGLEKQGMVLGADSVLLPQAVRATRHPRLAVWWKGGFLTPAFRVARFNANVCSLLHAEASDMLEEVQMKNHHLRAALSKSPWPILKCFSSNGQTCSLPLRAERRDFPQLPSKARLAYLAGFFDGDGCVSCRQDLSGCYLHVGQSFDQAEVLMLFYETFGGSITLQFGGMGLRKPVLQWVACGQSARHATQLLAPHSITKQKQLLLAAQWPEAKSDRKDCKTELRALKEYDSAVAGPCSWEYCAGFFDAEGCIHQKCGGVSLVLHLEQKHPRVLECLREFLAQSLGKDATVRKAGGSAHVLRICGLTSCKQILERLLAARLLCKAEQAKLALGLTTETAAQVDAEIGRLTGNQKFGKRLDAAGQERARKIATTQAQAARFRKGGQLAEARAKLREVEVHKQEHELLKAVHENQQLLQYMSKLRSLHDDLWDGPFAHGM
ncbi:petC-1 [Symbiodinium microadriaticum]|nr:petC-1 [Symbiodinium microadriaticum]